MQVTVPIQALSYCGFPNTDSTTQICAGDASSAAKDSCQVFKYSFLNTKLNILSNKYCCYDDD